MCCFKHKYDLEEIQKKQRSKEIDNILKNDLKRFKKEIKFLLLGTGGSGKSTFIKQMKIIHNVPFSFELLEESKIDIYDNIIEGMKILCNQKEILELPWEYPSSIYYSDFIMSWSKQCISVSNLDTYFHALQCLWSDSTIKLLQTRHRESYLVWNFLCGCMSKTIYLQNEAIEYFYKNLDRILNKEYVPTADDILHIRKPTRGIVELIIPVNNILFQFIDVGGQRSQRKKWLLCFENVSAILFLVSSTEYDQFTTGKKLFNKIIESQLVFETIANHQLLRNASIILFLSKMDLLKKKLARKDSNISDYFSEFSGDPFNIIDVQNFLMQFYLKVYNNRKNIYCHFTTVVDTHSMKIVYTDVKKSILQKNLQNLMLQ